jgi:chloramphenicol 3-O phosphotransferase
MAEIGHIVVLNGNPRSGKSSIASVIQDTFDGVWLNLEVDALAMGITPVTYLPGIGLRPTSRLEVDTEGERKILLISSFSQ